MKKLFALLITSFTLLSTPAQAECYCACINNEKVKVCTNSWDANYVYCGGTYCNGHSPEVKGDDQLSLLTPLLQKKIKFIK